MEKEFQSVTSIHLLNCTDILMLDWLRRQSWMYQKSSVRK